MVYFGPYVFDASNRELRRDGTPVKLERQPAVALDVLVSRAGHLVPRHDLRRAIWPDDVHVDFERGMNYCIRELRAALCDDARSPRYIETIPRQGYRFVGTLEAGPRARVDRRGRALVAAAALLAALTGAGVWDAQIASRETKAGHHASAARVLRALHAALF